MNERQLQHFRVLADTLNFRKAAARLNIVQPALSMSIKKLEDEFGVSLFTRTTRDVTLTAAGHVALIEINKALNHLDLARQHARLAEQGALGTLSVGFVGSASFALLPKTVRAFRMRYPKIVLTLQETSGRRVLPLVESGETDLGIIRTPAIHNPQVKIKTIEEGHFVAVVPTTGPWASTFNDQAGIDLSTLARSPFINYSYTESPMLHMAVINACREAGFSPQIVQEAIQVQTIVALVESGLGVGLVPSISVRHTPSNARFYPLKNPTPACRTGLAVAYNPELISEVGRQFIDVLLTLDKECSAT